MGQLLSTVNSLFPHDYSLGDKKKIISTGGYNNFLKETTVEFSYRNDFSAICFHRILLTVQYLSSLELII